MIKLALQLLVIMAPLMDFLLCTIQAGLHYIIVNVVGSVDRSLALSLLGEDNEDGSC